MNVSPGLWLSVAAKCGVGCAKAVEFFSWAPLAYSLTALTLQQRGVKFYTFKLWYDLLMRIFYMLSIF